MSMFSVTENMFELYKINHNLEKLVKYNIDRTENILREGKELLKYLLIRILWSQIFLREVELLELLPKN